MNDCVIIPENKFVSEPTSCNGHDRYSAPFLHRKIRKHILPCDISLKERLIEFEIYKSDKIWIPMKDIFGDIISEAKQILIFYPENNHKEPISIIDVDLLQYGKFNILKLIFEKDLPF